MRIVNLIYFELCLRMAKIEFLFEFIILVDILERRNSRLMRMSWQSNNTHLLGQVVEGGNNSRCLIKFVLFHFTISKCMQKFGEPAINNQLGSGVNYINQ